MMEVFILLCRHLLFCWKEMKSYNTIQGNNSWIMSSLSSTYTRIKTKNSSNNMTNHSTTWHCYKDDHPLITSCLLRDVLLSLIYSCLFLPLCEKRVFFSVTYLLGILICHTKPHSDNIFTEDPNIGSSWKFHSSNCHEIFFEM